MTRWILLLPLATACTTVGIVDEYADDWADATLRIEEPSSGSFLALEETHDFAASLTASDGTALPLDELELNWTASSDSTWVRSGASFTDDQLAVGLHDITVEVTLPNGDRLAHTVGGILLQSIYAGTYSGLFNTQITYDQFPADCSGAVVLIVDPYGEVVAGDASCLASLMGFDLQVNYVFDLDNEGGHIDGAAALDLFGFQGLEFPATGSLNPDSGTLDVDFGAGDSPLGQFIQVEGSVQAERVSRDAGLQP